MAEAGDSTSELSGAREQSELLRSWLLLAGVSDEQIHDLAYLHIAQLLRQNFDAQRLDDLLEEADGPPGWLRAMYAGKRWRDLLCELLEAHPTCVLLQSAVSRVGSCRKHAVVLCRRQPTVWMRG